MRATGGDATTLKWEAPAGRAPAHKVVARVDKYAEPSGGLFGIFKSPSLAGPAGLPNPIELRATVVHADAGFTARVVQLTAPKAYLPALEKNKRIALAVLADNVCVCIERVPDELKDSVALGAWLAAWTACKKD